MMVSFLLWFMLVSLFLMVSSSLLLTLVLLEIMVFFLLFYMTLSISMSLISPFLFLSLFSICVMESVVGLFALITLVSFTGTDYISSKSVQL